MAYPVPAPYGQAIRTGLALTYTAAATYNGAPVDGVGELRPVGGSVIDTTKPGVRRKLSLELAPTPGLFDALTPVGTRLTVTAAVRYTNRATATVPMGVYVIDDQSLTEGGGGLSVTAPDKWAIIQRARFIQPQASTPGATVTAQIQALIRGALGPAEPVNIRATRDANVPAQVWEKDRDKAIIGLADGIGAWVYFDRDGVATIADVPTIGATADWLVDASAHGVLTELDRQRSRGGAYNVVVVESSSTDAPFGTQVVWDNDPNSPTYAGPDPRLPGNVPGPFGVVPYFYDTPLPLTDVGAYAAGRTILARVTGLASQVSLGQVPNPAVDAFDVLDVLPPRQRYDIPRVLERHVADTVTHPLTVGPAQTIEGRSTRTDPWT